MNILILGAGGFIGSNLIEVILKDHPDWNVVAVDLSSTKIIEFLDKIDYVQANVLKDTQLIENLVKKCDVVLPLVAIANPSVYVTDPLKVFELDFESNLAVIKLCVKYSKRVIFPSTSEVYGMCTDTDGFKEFESNCVTGPICKQRWIYSCSKQMLDRVIYAYGERNDLEYTLFRPFNWVGPKLDDIANANSGTSRVLTQFLSNIVHGKGIKLVNGGQQSRSFTYISDGIDALIKILNNKNGCADKQIFNIGNPSNLITIAKLAEMVLNICSKHPKLAEKARNTKIEVVSSKEYFGNSYQDVGCRIPSIANAESVLGWKPVVNLDEAIRKTISFYFD